MGALPYLKGEVNAAIGQDRGRQNAAGTRSRRINPKLKEGEYMEKLEQQPIRMELQVGQLIRIIPAMNERPNQLEEKELARKVVPIHMRRAAHRT